MYNCKYEIGDLVVEKGADLFNSVKICKITNIEYVDEYSDMWDEEWDTKPYWFLTTELMYYVRENNRDFPREIGDFECFEDWEVEPLKTYLTREFTVQDYIDYKCNNKTFYEEDEE